MPGLTADLMKILYSHRTRSADGQYVHIRALTEALSLRGHELTMCGPETGSSQNAAAKKLDAGDGSAGVKSAMPKSVYEAAEFAYSAVGYKKLKSAVQVARPDVLYERYNLFYHAGVRLARSERLPFILEVNAPLAEERGKHGGLGLKKFAAWSQRSIWRAADAVLPVTGVLGGMVEAAGVPAEKISVIQNGVDDDFLANVDGSDVRARYGLQSKLVLGFTGFVRDWHGVDRVLEMMAQSGRDDLHLLLVGDGPAREALEQQAQNLGLAERFTVTGVVQREDMPAHVAAFDVALQPAVVDYASPLKLFEYMALGKPILAPDSANIKEVLANGESGLLFTRDDQNSFVEALSTLCADHELRLRLGASARQSLDRQGLTWAENAARVEKIAVDLVAKK